MIATMLLFAAEALTFTADRIAADGITRALTATGRVVAVSGPLSIRGDLLTRDADGLMRFHDPTCVTTCSNAVGHTHWNVTGEVEYRENDHVLLRNAVLRFYEIPVFWLPYLYYPLDMGGHGFSWMPGYMGHWGAYLLTKYEYHLLGDASHGPDTWWLRGATRFDLRYKNGVALGEELAWNLGDFGAGEFSIYYAWDQDYSHRWSGNRSLGRWNAANWGSEVDRDRYSIGFRHAWEATERDRVTVRGSYYADSFFRGDFQRRSLFNLKSQWLDYENSGVFWEHLENDLAAGIEVSGRLNDFYGMTGRLPELYLDVNPQPLFSLPVNYESATRFGYLSRDPAEYAAGAASAFGFNPGPWADYAAFRLDTYHRLTAPFRTASDTVSVVPRLAYRGTFWSESGTADLTGWNGATENGEAFRSVLEGGVTFAGRGTADIGADWRHAMEPYLDVLAQEAWLSGVGSNGRPYVFDNLDDSLTWEDQFAGRGRNLPYSYYGVTPGFRNVWSQADDKGVFRDVLDLDAYVAAQFNEADVTGDPDTHGLAAPDRPHYGPGGGMFVPGVRTRWRPLSNMSLGLAGEYDSDRNRLAYAAANWQHRLCKTFKYNVTCHLRDHRFWDYSSRPYSAGEMTSDSSNLAKMQLVGVGFEHRVCDWLAWGPHIRWDAREGELDTVGAWIDYLTDCLGFRLIVEYDNDYTTIDGYRRDDDWSFGFYIYLRAFGSDSGNVLFR